MAASGSSLIVAAIDFGTTFSSWGFSFRHSFEKEPAKIETKPWPCGRTLSLKGPTAILIHPDGKLPHSFGYEAEDKYAELMDSDDHRNWFFFQRFKMKLFSEKVQGLTRNLLLEDASGKRLSAVTVFGLSIKFLKDDLIKTCQSRIVGVKDSDIKWVLTVPAIWTDAAKQFMREAAELAGISHNRLTIALEPECASILCRHVPLVIGGAGKSVETFSSRSRYMIVDAGGGTVDMTVHEVTETGQLRELCKPSGGAFGGTRVDAAYIAFLEELFGKSVMDIFQSQRMEDYIDLLREFEVKKKTVGSNSSPQIIIKLPSSLFVIYNQKRGNNFTDDMQGSKFAANLKMTGDKLKINSKFVENFFTESINGTKGAISDLLKHQDVSGVKTLVLVGGLSESSVYTDAMKQEFPELTVVVPQDSSLAVLKGAVIYGHAPSTVCERVARYTYGYNTTHLFNETCSHPVGRLEKDNNGDMRCYDIFKVCVEMGTRVKVGTKQKGVSITPIYDDQDSITMDIYASTKIPQLVTDPACIRIGKIVVKVINKGRDQTFYTSMTFGGTEIEVAVEEKSTGAVTKTTVDFSG